MEVKNVATDLKLIQALVPAAPSGAATTSDWICCKNLHKVIFIISLYDGNTQDTVFSLYEATAVAGTSSQAITKYSKIWYNSAIGTSDLLVRSSDAASYTLANSGGGATKMVVIEFECANFSAGYDCLALYQDATNASNITSVIAIGFPRYCGANSVDSIAD